MKKLAKSSPRIKRKSEKEKQTRKMLFMAAVQSEAILIIIIVGVFFSHSAATPAEQILFYSLLLSLFGSHAVAVTVTLYTRLMLTLFSPQQHAQYAQGTSASGRRNCLSSKVSLSTAAAVMCVSYGAI